MATKDAQDVLNLWFRPPSNPDYGHPRPEWFAKNPEFDQMLIQEGFGLVYQREFDTKTWHQEVERALLDEDSVLV